MPPVDPVGKIHPVQCRNCGGKRPITQGANGGGLFDALGCQSRRPGGWPKRYYLGLFIAAVGAFERVNRRVAVGRMKIDDSVPYCAAACRAGIIDNEIQRHVSSLSLWANGEPLKRVRKDCDIARTHGRLAMAPQWNLTLQTRPCEFVEPHRVKYPRYPQH
jgi:hypothetical protein